MSFNGAHPYKPRGVFCYKGALMKWTGWGEKRIDYLVATGRLRSVKDNPKDYRRFFVESAQQIIEEDLLKSGPKRAEAGRSKS